MTALLLVVFVDRARPEAELEERDLATRSFADP